MDWTAGYASDVQYTAGFYQDQSPTHLNYVCALNGFEPVPTDVPFTYFELGFGRGLTANLLAAANPNGAFYATDFNAAHVAGASALAGAAGLTNLTLLESSFAELATGQVAGLPQFDFITMHGIYTWVTAENRAHIVEFIRRYLKPGGVVFLSYNAMPGWAAVQPLQRLLVEYGDCFPNRSDLQIDGAAKFVRKLVDAKAAYFEQNARLDHRLNVLQSADRGYLVHEYMHKHWQPLYHADVARELAQAKLDFVGTADLPLNYGKLYLSSEQQAAIALLPDPAMRETLKDYVLNASFRKDIFIKGARPMGSVRRAEWLGKVGMALSMPRADLSFKMALSIGERTVSAELYGPVFDALAERPHTLAELAALPAMAGQTGDNIAQIASLLFASGKAAMLVGDQARDDGPARRMNCALAAVSHYANDYNVLCAPLMRSAIPATLIERLLVGSLLKQPALRDIDTLANATWNILHGMGRSMARDGKALTTMDENLAELRLQIDLILRTRLPFWQQLNIVQ